MKEKLNSEEMNYVSGGYGSDWGPRISCGEAKHIAWNYIHEAGHYVGMPRYSLDNCWEVPVYNADGIECGNIIIDANSGEVLSFFVGC